jgi:hypothetical protein
VSDTRITKLAALFEKLSTPCPSFPAPGEYERYLKNQRVLLCEIARHQDIGVVRRFLVQVDAGSERFDATIWQTLQRAIDLAPLWLIQLKAYAKRDKEQVPDTAVGDPRFDKWAEGQHVQTDGRTLEWKTNLQKFGGTKCETDFQGNIRERN